jgi:hypothetical protein
MLLKARDLFGEIAKFGIAVYAFYVRFDLLEGTKWLKRRPRDSRI